MSLIKQVLVSAFVIVFAALAWFAFEHRDLILGDPDASASADRGGPGSAGRSGAGGAGGPPRPGGPGGLAQGGGGAGGGGFGGPAPVTTAAVVIDPNATDVRAIGTLAPANGVVLYPEVSGIVTAVAVKAGDKVNLGDPIVSIGNDDQGVAEEKARLELSNATAARERTEQLAKSNNATGTALADARAAEQQAAIALRSAEIEVAKRTVKAPFAGTIGLIGVGVGDLVGSQKALTTLDDLTNLTLAFEVPQRVAGLVAVGQELKAVSEAVPGRTFTGRITAVDSRMDPEARTLKVEATLRNEGEVLKPGMAVAIELSFPGVPQPSVPSLSVQWDRKGSFVWKLDGDVVHRLPVQVIARHSGVVTVAGDLKEGDEVVVEGVLRVREGATVARVGGADSPKPAVDGRPVASDGEQPVAGQRSGRPIPKS